MSGSNARRGFRYQDQYFLRRILPRVREVFRHVWRAGGHELLAALDAETKSFALEARPPGAGDDSAPWDITITENHTSEVIEAKSGAVPRSERQIFWRRLRRTVANSPDETFTPILVIDPDKENPPKWSQLAETAASWTADAPTTEPRAVHTCADLLEEALWHLCAPDVRATLPLTRDRALQLLARFQVHEVRTGDLASAVEADLTDLFPDQAPDDLSGVLRDWLDRRAIDPNVQQRYIGLGDFMRQVARVRESACLQPATWQRWQSCREEWKAVVRAKTSGRLGATGVRVSIGEAQPEITGILDASTAQLLLGGGGFGKTTLLVVVADAMEHGVVYWLVSAANLARSEIDDLAEAVRFLAPLAEGDEVIWLLVDGLDEMDSAECRERWGQVLARLATLARVRIVATIRDSDWTCADDLRLNLSGWSVKTLTDWPEALVRQLLAPTPFADAPSTLVSLLRTPIFLDLFWRTFIEDGARTEGALPVSRHELLSAFWHERLGSGSRRHTAITNRPACFAPVFAAASSSLIGFSGDGLNPALLGALAGEGVIVEVGRFQPRWQFRHPLLRDYALGQWCLMAGEASAVVERWSSIASGVTREGALRAMLESLAASTRDEFPEVTIASLAKAYAAEAAMARAAFVRALSGLTGKEEADPAAWPPGVQSQLSPDFAAEVITAAHHAKNLSWAPTIARWPVDAPWLDAAFVRSVITYLNLFVEQRKRPIADESARRNAQLLAATLRRWSEHPRLQPAFADEHRWQKKHAINLVSILLPDRETLDWIGREVPHFSWTTRGAALEALPHVTWAGPERAASLYRAAVGLNHTPEGWRLDEAIWSETPNLSYDAFEHSLTALDVRGQLLISTFPREFLPVALEMSEAWSHREHLRRRLENVESGLDEAFQAYFRDVTLYHEDPPAVDLRGGLVDDVSESHLLCRESPCEHAMKACLQHLAQTNPNMFEQVAPLFSQSKMASAHEAILVAGANATPSPEVDRSIVAAVCDERLYHMDGLLQPLADALRAVATRLSEIDQATVLANIEATRTSPHHFSRERPRWILLAAMPTDLLTAEQRTIAEDHREQTRLQAERESRRAFVAEEDGSRRREEVQDCWLGEWPEEWEREGLRQMYGLFLALIDQRGTGEDFAATAMKLQAATASLLPRWRAQPQLLAPNGRTWIWLCLRLMIEKLRIANHNFALDPATLDGCGELAVSFLEALARPSPAPGFEGDDAIWSAGSGGALALANEVLAHSDLPNGENLRERFDAVVTAWWLAADASAQSEIIQGVTFLKHWRRENGALRALTVGPLWTAPRAPGPIIAALALLPHLDREARESALRQVLARGDLPDLGNLGEAVGGWLGQHATFIDRHGARSELVPLIEEIIQNPHAFELLRNKDAHHQFFDRFCFGMKQQANSRLERTDLASDFSRWSIAAWRHVRTFSARDDFDSTSVARFAWCPVVERREPRPLNEHRILWWRSLRPLGEIIIREGQGRDIADLFRHMNHGELLDLVSPEELLLWVALTLDRLDPRLTSGKAALSFFGADDREPRVWQETLTNIAETIEKLWEHGRIHDPRSSESAHGTLVRLAAGPFHCDKAKGVLHRLLSGA